MTLLRRPRLPLAMAVILLAAAAGGLVFNLVMPQGVGWLPEAVARPLWRPLELAGAVRLQRQGALMVDARDPGHYKAAHLRGAVNLSPQERDLLWPLLEPQLRQAPAVVVYGRYRSRWPAAEIAQFLRRQGLRRVFVLQASLDQCRAAGLPVRQRRPRRQGP